MNCANHPETPAAAYCQFCGKPLCAQCVHKVGNVISCEPCLAARVGATAGTAQGATATNIPGASGYQPYSSGPLPPGTVQTPASWGINPGIALAVGWIPGVGAIYNGQIAKALVHVAVFAILIDLTHYNGLIGLLIPIWILYQIFDAYQTAEARRDGRPLPNPLGLNDVGHWFGARTHQPYSTVNPMNPYPVNPNPSAADPAPGVAEPVSGFAASYVPPYNVPPVPPMPPVPPNHYDTPDLWHRCCGGVPTGAVILIVLGVLFLLGNFGILSENWLDRGWPILLIGIGVWIVIRRSQTPPAGGVR